MLLNQSRRLNATSRPALPDSSARVWGRVCFAGTGGTLPALSHPCCSAGSSARSSTAGLCCWIRCGPLDLPVLPMQHRDSDALEGRQSQFTSSKHHLLRARLQGRLSGQAQRQPFEIRNNNGKTIKTVMSSIYCKIETLSVMFLVSERETQTVWYRTCVTFKWSIAQSLRAISPY